MAPYKNIHHVIRDAMNEGYKVKTHFEIIHKKTGQSIAQEGSLAHAKETRSRYKNSHEYEIHEKMLTPKGWQHIQTHNESVDIVEDAMPPGGDPNQPPADPMSPPNDGRTAKDKRAKDIDTGDEPIKKGSKTEIVLEPTTDDTEFSDGEDTVSNNGKSIKNATKKSLKTESFWADKMKAVRKAAPAQHHMDKAVEHQKKAVEHRTALAHPPEKATTAQKNAHEKVHKQQAEVHERQVAHHIHHFLQKDESRDGAKKLQKALHKAGHPGSPKKKSSWKFWENEDFIDMTREQLDEVSSKTLDNYNKAATKDASTIRSMTDKMDHSPIKKKLLDRLKKRDDGRKLAVNKQTHSRNVAVHAQTASPTKSSYAKRNHNESVELDENQKMGAEFRKQLKSGNNYLEKRHDEIVKRHHMGQSDAEIARRMKLHPAVVSSSTGILKKEEEDMSNLQKIKSILEARHNKGGGTKRQGLESDSDDHIINQLRKATNLRDHHVTFKDKSKHPIAGHIAKTALEKYQGLRTSQEKDHLSKAFHASHQSFKDALAGKIAPKKSHKITLPTKPFDWRK